jgi:predicted HTH domain antitoxin
MKTLNIQIPDYFLLSLNENEEELSGQMRLYTAMHFFKSHKLTLKQAADFAGLKLYQFIAELDRHEINIIDYDPEELEKELELFIE